MQGWGKREGKGNVPEDDVTSVIKVKAFLCQIRSCETTSNVKCVDQEVTGLELLKTCGCAETCLEGSFVSDANPDDGMLRLLVRRR